MNEQTHIAINKLLVGFQTIHIQTICVVINLSSVSCMFTVVIMLLLAIKGLVLVLDFDL